MNELIKVDYNKEQLTVSGRELHEFLEVETRYNDWFKRMCEYGFVEQVDFYSNLSKTSKQSGRPALDHQITIQMGKELCMIQRTKKGKMARLYFIAIEDAWNKPEMVMSRALKMAESNIHHLKIENSRLIVENTNMQPKADYFDELVDRNLLTNFRDTAKELDIKQNEFIRFLLDNKYVYRDAKGKIKPYAEKNSGLFELKETNNDKTGWVGVQTLITPKGRETFRLLLISNQEVSA